MNPIDKPRDERNVSRRTFFAATGLALAASAVSFDLFGRPHSAAAAVTWGYPFTFYSGRSRGFTGPNAHAGIDYTPGEGTPIHAVADGTIIISGVTGSNGAYGESIWIQHGDGYRTIYAHMQVGTRVPVGPVQRGQYIGRVGDTGRSFGAHLHIELHHNGVPINPDPFINAAPLAAGGTGSPPTNPAPLFTFGPRAIIDSGDRISLYAVRTDGNLWGASQGAASAGLSPWQKLGGDIGSLGGRPSVLQLASGIIAIYARTNVGTIVGTNQTAPGGSFTPWTTIGSAGNGIVGDPAAVQLQSGAIAIYAATDGGTVAGVAQSAPGGAFGSWTPIGSTSSPFFGTPAVTVLPGDRLALFARSATAEIHTSVQPSAGSAFPAWSALSAGGAGVSTDPALINDNGRVTVYAGAGSTITSASQASPGAAFDPWVNLGSGSASIGSAVPSVLRTGTTQSIYALGNDGGAWGSTVGLPPAPAGWTPIGSGATLMTALASVRTSAGINAIYGATTAGQIVGTAQGVPGGSFGAWTAL